jgi:hypothetical protein
VASEAGWAQADSVDWAAVWPDRRGNALVDLSSLDDSSGSLLVTIDADGAVASHSELVGSVMGCQNGIVIVDNRASDAIEAWPTADLGKPAWATANTKGYSVRIGPVYNQTSGVFWAWTEDGYVDTETGEPVGFAWNAESELTLREFATVGDEMAQLGLDLQDGGLARFDPSGAEIWAASLFDQPVFWRMVHAPGVVLVQEDGWDADEAQNVVALDINSGARLWTAECGEVLADISNPDPDERTGDTVGDVALAYAAPGDQSHLVAFRARDGEVLFRLECEARCELLAQGPGSAYIGSQTGAGYSIRAISLTDGQEYWNATTGDSVGVGPPRHHGLPLWVELWPGGADHPVIRPLIAG